MARKTTGNGITARGKKGETPLKTAGMPGTTDVSAEISNEGPQEIRNAKPVNPVKSLNSPVPINQNSLNQNSLNQNSISQTAANQGSMSPNLEEEIRHRAYELYLERRANGGDAGSPHHDWLTAEREILSRRNSHERKSARKSA